jgi:Kef-type K+ transport system membrane component KefB
MPRADRVDLSGVTRSIRVRSPHVRNLLRVLLATALAVPVVLMTPWSAGDGEIDSVARFLFSVAVILLVCHVLGEVLRRWGQPPVLGEILGGLVLGPSVLGLAWPAAQDWLFPPQVLTALNYAAQLGLITFMFLLGCELHPEKVTSRKVVGGVVAGGMGLPFIAGVGLAVAASGALAGGTPRLDHVLYFGIALSITALPVLARMLVDLELEATPLGVTALSCAAIGDGVAWTALTVLLAGAGDAMTTGLLAVAVVAFAFVGLRPALAVLVRRVTSDQLLLGTLAVGAIGFAGLTQLIGLHPVIGAFLFGVAVPRRAPAIERISNHLRGFALTILLPLFFAGVGLNTSVGLLGGDLHNWLLFGAVLVTAMATKYVGTGAGALLGGAPPRLAIQLGTLMNCRGVTELVVATIGLEYGLVNQLAFTMLVLVAIITTATTGPVMRRFADDSSTTPAATRNN